MNRAEDMVRDIRGIYGLSSPKVLSVMLQVPREKFVSRKYLPIAYKDSPVPIGFGQTMSQPYTVAFMTHLLLGNKRQETMDRIKDWSVLEIGTGSGYQAAVLSKLVKQVFSVEIVPELARSARKILKKLGYNNVYVRALSGEFGWKEKAPFDAIMITAGVEGKVPETFFDQLETGGVLVAPVGKGHDKQMTRYTKLTNKKTKEYKNRYKKEEFGIFHFVPFVKKY